MIPELICPQCGHLCEIATGEFGEPVSSCCDTQLSRQDVEPIYDAIASGILDLPKYMGGQEVIRLSDRYTCYNRPLGGRRLAYGEIPPFYH